MRKTILSVACVALLSGCAYNLDLMKRGSVATGFGRATQSGNAVEISMDGKVYRGKYTYVEQGFTTLGSATTFSGGRVAHGFGSGYSFGSAGQGNIIAKSDDGSGLRCKFSFSSDSQSGMGECLDDENNVWDMQINAAGGQ